MSIHRLLAGNVGGIGNLAKDFATGVNAGQTIGANQLKIQSAKNEIAKQGNINRLLQQGAGIQEISQVDPATGEQLLKNQALTQKTKNIDKDRIFQNLADFGFAQTQNLFPDVNLDPSFSVFDNESPEQIQLRERFKKGTGVSINLGGEGQPEAQKQAEVSETQQRASALGVPAARAPWENITDSKKRDDARIKFGQSAQSELSKDATKLEGIDTTIDRINRFLFLNKTTGTSPISGAFGIKQARELASPEFQEMSSLTDALTPAMRQGLPGSASERDTAMFRNATVGVGKDPETNKNVGTGLLVRNNNVKDRIAFKNDYFSANGHLRGANAEWNRYLEANPIFDPTKPKGSFEINPVRQSYQDFFGGKAPPERQAPQTIGRFQVQAK